jgi:glucuronoarabinoxylan endo-1,4-beta-xylanase
VTAPLTRPGSAWWPNVFILTAFVIACGPPGSRPIRVQWDAVGQTIDGFGAATNETAFLEPLSDRQMDFFYTTGGLGFSLLRIRDYPGMSECERDSQTDVCVARPGATLLFTDLKAAQMAVARGANVWSSQWSPPGSMKANGDFMKGGAIMGTDANYRSLATLLAEFVTYMASQGVPLSALSPQNEPDMSMWYPSATWTPRQIHDFIPHLRDAFRAANVDATKIVIPEQSRWEPRIRLWRDSFSLASDTMNDPSVAALVGILAAHNYDQRSPTSPPKIRNLTSQHIWETEASTFEPFDASITNALQWAQRIHFFLAAAHVNAFHFWYLTAGPNNHDNQTLVDQSGRVALRAYALGNWSKFVRPGWHRVEVRGAGSLLATAFQNETRTASAIVVVNPHSLPATNQRFDIGTAIQGPVTPWITSETASLAPQDPVRVSEGVFSYTIPARSIVTFASQTRSVSRAQ